MENNTLDILIKLLFHKINYKELNAEQKAILQLFFTIYVPKVPFPLTTILDNYQQNLTNVLKYFWFNKNLNVQLSPQEENIIYLVTQSFKDKIK